MGKIQKDELICELSRTADGWFKKGLQNRHMSGSVYSCELYPYRALFSPAEYNGLKVRNRVIYIPESSHVAELSKGAPSEREKRFFFERAEGNVGLLVTAPIKVSVSAFTCDAWREFTAGIHSRGSRVLAQLDLESEKLDPASALSLDHGFTKLISLSAQAAANAMSSGFDGICLNGCGGSLLDKMSSKAWNHRLLGKYSRADGFGAELVSAVRRACGENVPILYRFSLSHAVNESYGEEVKNSKELRSISGQRKISVAFEYMGELAAIGADLFEISLGCAETPWLRSPAKYLPAGFCLDAAKAAKDYCTAHSVVTGNGKPVCIIGSGRIDTPDTAEAAIRDGLCDSVTLDTAISADAAWCKKAAGCQCADIVPYYHSEECKFTVTPAPRRRTAVVGGGIKGLHYALEAAKNGHRVDLYEVSECLGGTLAALGRPTVNYAAANYLRYLLKCVTDHSSVTVKGRADCAILKAGNYESIVFATGSRPSYPAIDGWGEIPFVDAVDIMQNPEKLPDIKGRKIAVLGGDELGCSCAWWLREEMGCGRLAVIEEGKALMADSADGDRAWMLHRLDMLGVKLITLAKPLKISGGYLYFDEAGLGKKTAPEAVWMPEKEFDSEKAEATLRAVGVDLIVVATGKTDRALYNEAVEGKIANEILYI